MSHDFLTNDRTTFARQTHISSYRPKKQSGNYVWTVVITLLTAMTTFSWIFCAYVFGHPERAFNYNLLLNLEKLEPLTDFSPSRAPRGKFYSSKDLYSLYYGYSNAELNGLSAVLRRQYVLNFDDIDGVTYIKGSFRIYNARVLGPKDVFPSGLALRAQSVDYPNVVIEYVLPSDDVPQDHYDFDSKNNLTVGTSTTCAAVINISRIDEDRLCFTAVPIVYGEHETPSQTIIATRPPTRLNLAGGWPLTSENVSEGQTAAMDPALPTPAGG